MSQEPKPKLIIDEDWKSKVQQEKEILKHHEEAGTAAESHAESPPPRGPAAEQLPPASFSLLVTMLATQVMAACGVLHDPREGEPRVEPEVGKHFIDLLGMLEDKTKGNLSAEEESLLGQTLYELRMLYVSLSKRPPSL